MIAFFISVVLILILLSLISHYFLPIAYLPKVRAINGCTVPPTLPGKFLIGNNFDLLKLNTESTFEFFRECSKKYKKSYFFYLFNVPIYNITKAEDAEHVLSSPQIIQKSATYFILRSFLGTGLLTSTGSKWHMRRKLLTPAFHFSILQEFFTIFKDESIKFINAIDENTENPNHIYNLSEIVPRFTLNTICETALGVKLDNSVGSAVYRANVNQIQEIIIQRCLNCWYYNDTVYGWFGQRELYEKSLERVHKFSSSIVKKRRNKFISDYDDNYTVDKNTNKYEDKKRKYAMLDTLLAAEAKNEILHRGICEEVDTFMFEGFDTTSAGLIFSLLMIALHENVQEKAVEEIYSLTDNIESLRISDYNQLKYLECIIKETLRLFPPVPLIGRELTETTTIGSLILPPMTQILIHIYDVHRDPSVFPEPERFDPDRFLSSKCSKRSPYAYIPFSAGPRNCIGQKFAMLEMKVLLSRILANYKIVPITMMKDIRFLAGLVLKTKNDINVQFTKRNFNNRKPDA